MQEKLLLSEFHENLPFMEWILALFRSLHRTGAYRLMTRSRSSRGLQSFALPALQIYTPKRSHKVTAKELQTSLKNPLDLLGWQFTLKEEEPKDDQLSRLERRKERANFLRCNMQTELVR